MNQFEIFLKKYQDSFKNHLEPIFNDIFENEKKDFQKEVQLTLDLIFRGGKRMRSGMFSYLIQQKPYLEIEALIELLHVAFLIHDDVFDHAEIRRGRASFHKAIKDSDLTLAWGDLLFAKAQDWFRKNEDGQFSSIISAVIYQTCFGQMKDMALRQRENSQSSKNTQEPEIIKSYELKTGMYTFYLPIALALKMNRLKWDNLALEQFCRILGVVFQVLDDLLIFTPKFDAKSIQTDFEQRQLTYVLQLVQRLSGESVFNKKHTHFSDWMPYTRNLFYSCRCLDVIQSELHHWQRQLNVSRLNIQSQVLNQSLNDIIEFMNAYTRQRLQALKK